VLPRARSAGLAAALAAAALIAISFALAAPGRAPADWTLAFCKCFGVALAIATVPALGVLLALRRTLPLGARSIGAAAGAFGGALGGLVLHLHCPFTLASHVALAHGGAVAVGALLGALLAPLLVAL
jgi:hypothetical protein